MNTTEFERLKMLMQTEQMSAKDFATEVGISPSTMSNILGGRNKPSLEVMQRVLNRFRLVSPEWLILGVGTMYKTKQAGTEQTLFDIAPTEQTAGASPSLEQPSSPTNVPPAIPAATATVARAQAAPVQQAPFSRTATRYISKVIVFYDDGSFEELYK